MVHTRLDGNLFSHMIYLGANFLHKNYKTVDALNVFPVPDGDTGTNMNLTFTSGVEELSRKPSYRIDEAAQSLAKGLLMGARGNSGVILSQLFRGFSKFVQGKTEISGRQFADALKSGVDSAYQAVMKPVEGTVLTVAREAAEAAVKAALSTDDILAIMEKTYEQAQITLLRTPEMLPVLKEVGVVDSGGQGLVFIYEGFLRSLRGETLDKQPVEQLQPLTSTVLDALVEEQHNAQLHMKTEDITFGYCTEFMIWHAHSTEKNKKPFVESTFRAHLNTMGDSLLVVSDDDIVKVHIHAEHPGAVLDYAQQFGSLHKIKIDNMREQHARILKQEENKSQQAEKNGETAKEHLPYGVIAVAAGSGIADIFQSLGVHHIVEGGQTMNPSTEDFIKAIDQLHADKVIILPNNKNIIMAAEQAAKLASVPVAVIPTKSVPQGMAAMLAFQPDAELTANQSGMTEAFSQVKTGQVTFAVRDTKMGDVSIHEGDYIGIAEGTIVTASSDLIETAKRLLEELVTDETDLVSIICGEDVSAEQGEVLSSVLSDHHPDVEVEVLNGKQPLYPFIFSVE